MDHYTIFHDAVNRILSFMAEIIPNPIFVKVVWTAFLKDTDIIAFHQSFVVSNKVPPNLPVNYNRLPGFLHTKGVITTLAIKRTNTVDSVTIPAELLSPRELYFHHFSFTRYYKDLDAR